MQLVQCCKVYKYCPTSVNTAQPVQILSNQCKYCPTSGNTVQQCKYCPPVLANTVHPPTPTNAFQLHREIQSDISEKYCRPPSKANSFQYRSLGNTVQHNHHQILCAITGMCLWKRANSTFARNTGSLKLSNIGSFKKMSPDPT